MIRRGLLFALCVALLLCAGFACAEEVAQGVDLSALSQEELLALREEIEARLLELGYNPYYDIERGDKGENVSALQEALRDLGFYSGAISGKFDNETQKAFKQFEKANGLENDGKASKEDQAVLYGGAASGKVEATPQPKVEPTADPLEALYADYGELDYEDCSRYPERHFGEKVALRGKVVQVIGDKNSGFNLRFATSGSDNIVFVVINNQLDFNILENDRLTIYARMEGTFTYESVLGQQITLPAATADEVVLK